MQHVGIVACSAEGAALCYRTICIEGAEQLGGYAHPEITMHSHSFERYMECIERDDWDGVAELMLSSAERLARAGADFLICPDNTIHQALPRIRSASPIPWLHIADVVADEAAARGFRKVAISGTRWLVKSDVYPDALATRGLEFARPRDAERDEINRIIMDELVRGVARRESVRYLAGVYERMGAQDRCDCVVLGCTELPLVMHDENSPLPTLDSTRLLARAALAKASR